MTSGYNAYQQNSILTAPPEQLVLMLYDGANRFGRRALAAFENESPAEATQAIARVTAIVHELNGTLDMEVGGEIAQNLRSIYVFCADHLMTAALESDPRKVSDVLNLLGDLRGAFAEAAKGVKAA